MKRWLPVVVTAGIFSINQQVAMYFASGLEDGSGSALTNALVFWQLPFGVFGASITTVLFPKMSILWQQKDTKGLAETVAQGLKALSYLLIPSGVGLFVLGTPMIAVALQRGAFEVIHTEMAGKVLMGYSLGLFSVAAFTFLQRAFYAVGDYRTPVIAATTTLLLDIVFSLWLKETPLRVTGLAVANSISFTLGLLVFARGLRRRLLTFRLRSLVGAFLTALGAALLAVAVLRLLPVLGIITIPRNWWHRGSSFANLVWFLAEGMIFVGVVSLIYWGIGLKVSTLRGRAQD